MTKYEVAGPGRGRHHDDQQACSRGPDHQCLPIFSRVEKGQKDADRGQGEDGEEGEESGAAEQEPSP